MNLWFVLFLAAVLATLTGLMVLLWRLYYSEDAPHTLDVAQLDQLLSTLRGLGFERIQRRSLFDVRTWRAEQRLSHMTMVVEFGDGTRRDYTRMTCTYDHPLCQGVQILRQEPLALSRRMMRLAEVKSGDARVDPKFIMLARDAERFEDLLSRPVRDLLLDVEDGAGDVQITDESVYAYYGALLTSDALVKKTEQVRALARTLGGYSAHRGPISSLTTRSYNIDSEQLYLREGDPSGDEHHSRALDLPDPQDRELRALESNDAARVDYSERASATSCEEEES